MLDRISQTLWKFASSENGATAIEYALIASFIFLGLVPIVQSMGDSMDLIYQRIQGYFDTVLGA